ARRATRARRSRSTTRRGRRAIPRASSITTAGRSWWPSATSWPDLPPRAVYLWTLPLFHCNGWCYSWAVTLVGGTHVCLRKVDPPLVFRLIAEHRVTNMCGAPTVLSILINAPAEQKVRFDHVVDIQTGGASPPAKVIQAMSDMGFRV